MARRPPLLPNAAFLIGVVPLAAVLSLRSGAWWVLGIVGVLLALRMAFWLAAPYSRFAYKAIEPRYETPEELAKTLEPFERRRILGPMMRFGAATMGVRAKKSRKPPPTGS